MVEELVCIAGEGDQLRNPRDTKGGTQNKISISGERSGAGDRTRTYDPIITNDVLYQLSYTGTSLGGPANGAYRRAGPW